MPDTKRFALDQGEAASYLWKKLKGHMEARLALLRSKNDDPNKDGNATAMLRGRIKELKNLMALDNPAPSMEAEDSD